MRVTHTAFLVQWLLVRDVDCAACRRALGLHIRSVDENSRSKREGIFQDDDCIIKINDTELMDKSFSQWVNEFTARKPAWVLLAKFFSLYLPFTLVQAQPPLNPTMWPYPSVLHIPALGMVSCFFGDRGVALQMALETERFQMQAPNGVVEENSQNAWRIEAV